MKVSCANRRMPIGTSDKRSSFFYEMEAETFYFIVTFWFDDKIVIKRKTGDICMVETVPYISGTSDRKTAFTRQLLVT